MRMFNYYNLPVPLASDVLQEMIGVTFTKVEYDKSNETILFVALDGNCWLMGHMEQCNESVYICNESVYIDDIAGDLGDLTNSPMLVAEECSHEVPQEAKGKNDDSLTWTFYRFRTNKGTVTIKWYGTSNGYYSESVNILKLVKEKD